MKFISHILATAFIMCIGQPALAEWPTTEFIAVPMKDKQTSTKAAEKDFEDHAVNGERLLKNFFFDSWSPAPPPEAAELLKNAFGGASSDAERLANAGARAPNLAEYFIPRKVGGRHIPVYWETFKGVGGGAAWSCVDKRITISNEVLSLSTLATRWAREFHPTHPRYYKNNPAYIENATNAMIMHELIHAIQAAADSPWDCIAAGGGGVGTANSSWIAEATANGISHYLIWKRVPNLLEIYNLARLERYYSKPLYDTAEKYTSQSLIFYLMEATEVDGKSDLSLAVDILTKFTAAAAQTRDGTLRKLASIVEDHSKIDSHKRPFALTFAEFLTEYASYSNRHGISEAEWMQRGFHDCAEYALTPGSVDTIEIIVSPNAARCIKVDWSGFSQAVALQFLLEGTEDQIGSLHLGQASYHAQVPSSDEGSLVTEIKNTDAYCYDVTSRLDNRLSRPASEKCMLRRGAQLIDQAGGTDKHSATWTSDFNLGGVGNVAGNGHAYFILTNAAEDITTTKKATVTLSIGTNMALDKNGASLAPRTSSEVPAKAGRTLMDSRVHAIGGGPGRVFFDGRSIFGDGIDLGFLEAVPGSEEIDAGGTIVRSRKYMIMLAKDKAGFPNQAAIIRDPQTSGGQLVTTLGTKGSSSMPSCGYQVPASLELLSTSGDVLHFVVSGDMFNFTPSKMMAAGPNGFCATLRATHVEYASIEVSLPFPALYDGTVRVSRISPPMQEIYDDLEFPSGPSFGGIATSRSLLSGGGAPSDSETEPASNAPDGPTSPSGNASSAVQCICHCPSIVSPSNTTCVDQCAPTLQICPDPSSTEAIAADRSRYDEFLKGRDLTDSVRDMLLSDLETMSGETRSLLIREALGEPR